MKYIPSMVIVAFMLCYPLTRANAALDVDFLKSCQVIQADVDIIPQLSSTVQQNVAKWTVAKDCGSFGPLRATRAYYRRLQPKTAVPLTPPGWNLAYLTDAEFQHYMDILDSAPW